MGNPHRKPRDLSTHQADLDGSQSSFDANLALARLDTTQGDTVEASAAVEETRTHLQLVPDLKEEPETMSIEDALARIATIERGDIKRLQTLEDECRQLFKGDDLEKSLKAINIKKQAAPEPDGNRRPVEEIHKPVIKQERKQEVGQSPADLWVKTVEEIDNMDTLEEFAKDCKRKGLLMGGSTEKGWWIKPKNSDNSKALVDVISKRKGELIDMARKEKDQAQKEKNLAGQLRKIESFNDMDELRRHLQALKHFKHIKIGANDEPIADDQVFGSKEIVEALNKQRGKILKANKEKKALEDLVKKYKKQ